MLTRIRTLALLPLLLLPLLTGCSDSSGPTDSSPSSQTTAPEPSGPVEADALRFGSPDEGIAETSYVVGCADRFPVNTFYDEVVADRDLTLDSVDVPRGEGIKILDAWVAPLPEDRISESGLLADAARGTSLEDVDAWPDRIPLTGAELGPDQPFAFYLRLDVRPGTSSDGFDFAWTSGGAGGTSTYSVELRGKAACDIR